MLEINLAPVNSTAIRETTLWRDSPVSSGFLKFLSLIYIVEMMRKLLLCYYAKPYLSISSKNQETFQKVRKEVHTSFS